MSKVIFWIIEQGLMLFFGALLWIFKKRLAEYIDKQWVTPLTYVAKKRLVKTERDYALLLHYILRGKRSGHSVKNPYYCRDGKCTILT